LNLIFSFVKPINSGHQPSNTQEDGGHFGENVPGQLGEGKIAQLLFPPQEAYIDVRDVEDRSSPDPMFAPDLLDIAIRLRSETPFRLREQFLSIAEESGFGGADLDTARFLPLEGSGMAEVAFLDRRPGAFPVVPGRGIPKGQAFMQYRQPRQTETS